MAQTRETRNNRSIESKLLDRFGWTRVSFGWRNKEPDSDDPESGRTVMSDFFASPAVQAGTAVLVLCILIAAGFYLVSSYRDYAADDRDNGGDPLEKLREMHRKGDISDQEFRTIQATTDRQPPGAHSEDDSASQAETSPNPDETA